MNHAPLGCARILLMDASRENRYDKHRRIFSSLHAWFFRRGGGLACRVLSSVLVRRPSQGKGFRKIFRAIATRNIDHCLLDTVGLIVPQDLSRYSD